IEDSDGKALMRIHTQAGVLVLLLAALRIVSRLAAHAPDTHDRRSTAGRAAALLHLCFYLILLALPLLGWAYVNAKGKPVVFFGLELPRLLGRDRDLADTLQSLHTTLGWTLLAMIGVHALGALWHHFGAKDDVLRSMLPWKTTSRVAPSPAPDSLPASPTDEVNE
ncbi:MAG: cytochrome b, partial [Lysobacteraceae bacterium]